MSRWFRVDDGLVDDPKVQQLPATLIVVMLNLWCVTSQCGGNLPPIEQIAFKLRLTVPKARKVLDDLRAHGLIDDDDAGTRPHNWNARQFKSDVTDPTNAARQKRFRDRDKTVTPTVTKGVTKGVTETVTVTDTRADTEQNRKKDAAEAAPELPLPSEEADLFRRGKAVLGASAGGLIKDLLKAKGGKIPLARAAIEQASTKHNAREYVGAIIRGAGEQLQTVDPRL